MAFLELFLAGPYNVALIIAVVFGLVLSIRAGRTAGFSSLAWSVLLVAAVSGGLIGSTFIFLDFHAPRLGEKSNLGGLIAGIAIVALLAQWLRIGALRALDVMAAPTLVGMAIGRVGCFFAGCCAGTHTNLPWGMHVDDSAEAIHPVQLYESVADLLLVGALARFVPMGKPGNRVGIAVVWYAVIRLLTEFVRAGRTSVYGLNPVQWSVLAIGVVVAAWLYRRGTVERKDTAAILVRGRGVAEHGEQRAPLAAMLVTGSLMYVTLGFPNAFGEFERAFLMTAALAIGSYAIIRCSPRGLARPLLPSLGALMLLDTPADSVPRKREIIVGGGILSGAYTGIVGRTLNGYTDCEGMYHDTPLSTYAERKSTSGWFSGGFRQRTASGKRITVEGQVLAGSDKLQWVDPGPVDAPVANKTSILAGGAALALEGTNQHVRINVIGGQMSNAGTATSGITGSVTARTGVKDGFFVEGNLAPPQWYATTGDFSYAGVGYMMSKAGARLLIGAGGGLYTGLHVPMRRFEFDVIGRAPASTSKVESGANISVGLKTTFTIP